MDMDAEWCAAQVLIWLNGMLLEIIRGSLLKGIHARDFIIRFSHFFGIIQ
jgi:hypothetical protein